MPDPIMAFIAGTVFTQRKIDIDQVKLLMTMTERGDAPEWYGIRQLDKKFIVCVDIEWKFERDEDSEGEAFNGWRMVRR